MKSIAVACLLLATLCLNSASAGYIDDVTLSPEDQTILYVAKNAIVNATNNITRLHCAAALPLVEKIRGSANRISSILEKNCVDQEDQEDQEDQDTDESETTPRSCTFEHRQLVIIERADRKICTWANNIHDLCEGTDGIYGLIKAIKDAVISANDVARSLITMLSHTYGKCMMEVYTLPIRGSNYQCNSTCFNPLETPEVHHLTDVLAKCCTGPL